MPPSADTSSSTRVFSRVDDRVAALLSERIAEWVDDPESDVEYAEKVDDRWAVRMRQSVREATTVWFWVGDRSLIAEAYVIPAPPSELEPFRIALARNQGSFRVNFALDHEGALILRARVPVERVDHTELEYLLAEFYELVETTFRPLVTRGFEREKKG